MEIRRTANAGVLLTLDQVQILIDGVCREVDPYPATPENILPLLKPDVLLFTHGHPDHFDPVLARRIEKPIYAPRQVAQQLSNVVTTEEVTVGKVKITAVSTRHMGHYGKTTEHCSYVVEGSKCLWFMGDASPMELRKLSVFPKPDVLVVPYPYISTPAAIKQVADLLPCKIVLVHMPLPENDPEKIWLSIAEGRQFLKDHLCIPQMGENLNL